MITGVLLTYFTVQQVTQNPDRRLNETCIRLKHWQKLSNSTGVIKAHFVGLYKLVFSFEYLNLLNFGFLSIGTYWLKLIKASNIEGSCDAMLHSSKKYIVLNQSPTYKNDMCRFRIHLKSPKIEYFVQNDSPFQNPAPQGYSSSPSVECIATNRKETSVMIVNAKNFI